MSTKESWPELVGKPVDEAVAQIKSDDSTLDVIKLEEGSPTTRDYRPERVRVFYNTSGNVSSEPRVG